MGTYGFSTDEWKAAVEFRNAYGELAATNIAKLPFYGGLTIVYAVVAMCVERSLHNAGLLTKYRFWGFLYAQNRHDICRFPPGPSRNTLLRNGSTRAKLYHGNYRLSHR